MSTTSLEHADSLISNDNLLYSVILLRKCCILEKKLEFQQSEFEILFKYFFDILMEDI